MTLIQEVTYGRVCLVFSFIAFCVSAHHCLIPLLFLLYTFPDCGLLLGVYSPSPCKEVLVGFLGLQGFSKAASPHIFLLSVLKLFLAICWTLREEPIGTTFRSNQCSSNSYPKESYRKPWSSYKNLDCLLFIRFTRTLVFGYQALLKPPTVLFLSP